MTDRKGVLVRFPPDLLADLDAEAKLTGKSRTEVIVARCAAPKSAPVQRQARGGFTLPSPPASGLSVQLGPTAVAPGSRLKSARK